MRNFKYRQEQKKWIKNYPAYVLCLHRTDCADRWGKGTLPHRKRKEQEQNVIMCGGQEQMKTSTCDANMCNQTENVRPLKFQMEKREKLKRVSTRLCLVENEGRCRHHRCTLKWNPSTLSGMLCVREPAETSYEFMFHRQHRLLEAPWRIEYALVSVDAILIPIGWPEMTFELVSRTERCVAPARKWNFCLPAAELLCIIYNGLRYSRPCAYQDAKSEQNKMKPTRVLAWASHLICHVSCVLL